jgi:hypothetical protein
MWKLSMPDRLAAWKRFRNEIDDITFERALENVDKFWSRCPFTPFYLEHNKPELWPDPWTMIAENCYCDLAKALGIVYTLYLSAHRDHDYALRVYKHKQNRGLYNLVWIDDGKYVLNLEQGEILNKKSIPNELELLIEYNSSELKLDRY